MRIFWTKHAKERLKERSISMLHIRQAVANPNYRKPTFDDKILIGKKFGTKTLELVCLEYPDKIVIVTLYYL